MRDLVGFTAGSYASASGSTVRVAVGISGNFSLHLTGVGKMRNAPDAVLLNGIDCYLCI
jgi:hypothetical protein